MNRPSMVEELLEGFYELMTSIRTFIDRSPLGSFFFAKYSERSLLKGFRVSQMSSMTKEHLEDFCRLMTSS